MTPQNILWPTVMGPSQAQLPPPNPTETPYTLPTLECSQFLKHHLTSYFQLYPFSSC